MGKPFALVLLFSRTAFAINTDYPSYVSLLRAVSYSEAALNSSEMLTVLGSDFSTSVMCSRTGCFVCCAVCSSVVSSVHVSFSGLVGSVRW